METFQHLEKYRQLEVQHEARRMEIAGSKHIEHSRRNCFDRSRGSGDRGTAGYPAIYQDQYDVERSFRKENIKHEITCKSGAKSTALW